VAGFLTINVVPVVAYFKMKKLEITNPLLAAAIQENEVEMYAPKAKHYLLPKNIDNLTKLQFKELT
jgi:hypothetical protein